MYKYFEYGGKSADLGTLECLIVNDSEITYRHTEYGYEGTYRSFETTAKDFESHDQALTEVQNLTKELIASGYEEKLPDEVMGWTRKDIHFYFGKELSDKQWEMLIDFVCSDLELDEPWPASQIAYLVKEFVEKIDFLEESAAEYDRLLVEIHGQEEADQINNRVERVFINNALNFGSEGIKHVNLNWKRFVEIFQPIQNPYSRDSEDFRFYDDKGRGAIFLEEQNPETIWTWADAGNGYYIQNYGDEYPECRIITSVPYNPDTVYEIQVSVRQDCDDCYDDEDGDEDCEECDGLGWSHYFLEHPPGWENPSGGEEK
jgi:hypothetical protein